VEAASRFHPNAAKQLELKDNLHPGLNKRRSGIEAKGDRRRSLPRRGRTPVVRQVDQAKLYAEIQRLISDTNVPPEVLRSLLRHVTNRASLRALMEMGGKKIRKAAPAIKRRARQLGMKELRSGMLA
jgi:hypothetical protein